MVLPRLHWKKITYFPNLGSITTNSGVLDAIYNAFQATTYDDGTTRTGSTTEWTIARYQNAGTTEAVYGTPPAAAVSDLRVIIAGQNSVTKTPTMDYGPFSGLYLWAGINKGSGAFNAWDNASPFTTGNFSGYNSFGTPSTYGYTAVLILESEEALAVFIGTTASWYVMGFVAGAFIDPISVSASDVESNGRLYSFATSGSFMNLSAGNSFSFFLNNNGTLNSNNHHRSFVPGAGTKRSLSLIFVGITPSTHYISPGNSTMAIPFVIKDDTGKASGYGRSMFFANAAGCSVNIYNSAGDVLYYPVSGYFGGSPSNEPRATNFECLLFRAY